MIVYRIAQLQYSDDLSGSGASLYGGRWNSKGIAALYCSQHISLAVLEMVVNFSRSASPLRQPFDLLEIEIPDSLYLLALKNLKSDWIYNQDYTRYIGDNFLTDEKLLAIQVPSAVIPEESNFMINPKHKLMDKVKIVSKKKYGFDNRLLN